MLLFGCNSAEEAAQISVNSALESVIESQTSQEVDLADVGSFDKNSVKASFIVGGQEKITGKTNMVGTMLGSNDANGKILSFQLQDEEGTMLMIAVSQFPDNFSLPFSVSMYKQNEAPEDSPSATVTFLKISENGMFSYLSFDGTLTIKELNDKKVSLILTGKTGDAADLENPQNWKDMKAEIVITSPIIQTMGFDKNEILK